MVDVPSFSDFNKSNISAFLFEIHFSNNWYFYWLWQLRLIYHSNYHPFWCWIWFILVSEGPFERNISSVIRDKSIAVWKVFCQSVVTSILRNRNFWDSFRFPLVFLTTKACKAPINGTHTSKGHLLKISLNHTLDSALLVEGFAKIVPVFNVPALFKKKCTKWVIKT